MAVIVTEVYKLLMSMLISRRSNSFAFLCTQRSLLDNTLAKTNQKTISKAQEILAEYRCAMGKLSVPMLKQVHVLKTFKNAVVCYISTDTDAKPKPEEYWYFLMLENLHVLCI